jgi:hypothetical protein
LLQHLIAHSLESGTVKHIGNQADALRAWCLCPASLESPGEFLLTPPEENNTRILRSQIVGS